MERKDNEQLVKDTLDMTLTRCEEFGWSDAVWVIFIWFPFIAFRCAALLLRYGILELIDKTLGRCSDRIALWVIKRCDKLCDGCDLFALDMCDLAYNHFKDRLSDFDRNIIEISLQELSE